MKLRFENKIAVITGAGNGIGYEIARQLMREGAFVVLNDINEVLALKSESILNEEGCGKCVAVPGNAADMNVISKIISTAVNVFGGVHIAIANAGNTIFNSFFEVEPAEFGRVVNLNIQGSFFLAQKAAKQMHKQGEGGRILLMSSTVGLQAYPNLTTYSMTKSALHMMAKSLVLDLSKHNITINVVAPGATITERTELENPFYERSWSDVIPKGRIAYPGDIANAALFLLSSESEHITGHTLVVDGGWTCTSPYPNLEGGL